MLLPLNNRCFAALPVAIRTAFQPHLVLESLPRGVTLEAITTEPSMYFPISCVLAMTATATDYRGPFLRFGGNGVVAGVRPGSSSQELRSEAQVCMAGYAFRLPSQRIGEYLESPLELEVARVKLLRAVMKRALIGAFCASSHTAAQRIARLLLSSEDEVGLGNPILLGQTQLSQLLFLRRETVTHVLRDWVSAGVIDTARSRIQVCKRAALTADACSCYESSLELDQQEFVAWTDIKWRHSDRPLITSRDDSNRDRLHHALHGVYSGRS